MSPGIATNGSVSRSCCPPSVVAAAEWIRRFTRLVAEAGRRRRPARDRHPGGYQLPLAHVQSGPGCTVGHTDGGGGSRRRWRRCGGSSGPGGGGGGGGGGVALGDGHPGRVPVAVRTHPVRPRLHRRAGLRTRGGWRWWRRQDPSADPSADLLAVDGRLSGRIGRWRPPGIVIPGGYQLPLAQIQSRPGCRVVQDDGGGGGAAPSSAKREICPCP